MLCSDLYFSIYSYLDSQSKFKCGITCKQFNKFLSKDIKIAKNNVRDEFNNICNKFNGFNLKEIISLLLKGISSEHLDTKLLGPGYIAVRTFDDYTCTTKIDVYNAQGSKELELNIDYNYEKRNKYSKRNYFVTSCVHRNIGFYEDYRGNRFEYYMNKKFVGINCIRDDLINDYPLVKNIFKTINKYLIVNKIYPSIYKLIKMEDTETNKCYAKFVKSSELSFDNKLFNYLESLD